MADTSSPPASAFALRIQVEPADVDELGHVSNVRYVDWMFRAAVAHSLALGWDMARYRQAGGVFLVRRHEIDYLASALPGDEVLAYTWPTSLEKATAERRHVIARSKDGKVLARGLNVWVFVSFEAQRPMRIPKDVLETFDPAKFV